jgi:hypothetical protein
MLPLPDLLPWLLTSRECPISAPLVGGADASADLAEQSCAADVAGVTLSP